MNEQSWILLKIDKDWEIRHQFHTTEWIFITSLGRYLSIILKSANAIFRLYWLWWNWNICLDACFTEFLLQRISPNLFMSENQHGILDSGVWMSCLHSVQFVPLSENCMRHYQCGHFHVLSLVRSCWRGPLIGPRGSEVQTATHDTKHQHNQPWLWN